MQEAMGVEQLSGDIHQRLFFGRHFKFSVCIRLPPPSSPKRKCLSVTEI